jgi:hypothetical protein
LRGGLDAVPAQESVPTTRAGPNSEAMRVLIGDHLAPRSSGSPSLSPSSVSPSSVRRQKRSRRTPVSSWFPGHCPVVPLFFSGPVYRCFDRIPGTIYVLFTTSHPKETQRR